MGAYLRRFREERSDHAGRLRDDPRESGSVRIRRPRIDTLTIWTGRRKVTQPRCLGDAAARDQRARRKYAQPGRWRFALRGLVALTRGMFTVAAVLDHAVGGFDRCNCKNSSIDAGPSRDGRSEGQEAESVRKSSAARTHAGNNTEKNAEHNGVAYPHTAGIDLEPVNSWLACRY